MNHQSEIIKIWNNQKHSKRTPALYPILEKNALLFIGLNPSSYQDNEPFSVYWTYL